MNPSFRPLVVLAATFSGSIVAHAQISPPSTPPARVEAAAEAKLEELPAKLAELDQELKQQLTTYLAVIDTEAKVKRISETYAQSLRWSGQTAVENSSLTDSRSMISTARTPIDNAAVVEARAVLDAAVAASATRRSTLMSGASRTLRREITAALRGEPTTAELKAMAERLDLLRELPRNRAGTNSADAQSFTYAGAAIAWLLALTEASESRDPEKLRTAIQQYPSAGDLVPDVERKTRISRALQPLITQMGTARKALHEAVEIGKPARDRQAALIRFQEAVQQLNNVVSGQSIAEIQNPQGQLNAYRSMEKALAAMEAGDAYTATNALQELRNSTPQAGKGASWLSAQLITWEAQVVESSTKNAAERRAKIRTQLAEVKNAGDLDTLAGSLNDQIRAARSRSGNDQEEYRELAQQLTVLATAWTATSPALLQQDRYANSSASLPFAKEIAALRKTVERDVLARTLRVPELNQPPLAELPNDAALDRLADDLAKRAEWRRLYQLVQARGGFPGQDPRMPQQDLLNALQLFLAGQNFELAEQWTDAVQSYKGVLRSTSERAPITAAAERVKALTKAHPETNAAAPTQAPVRPY